MTQTQPPLENPRRFNSVIAALIKLLYYHSSLSKIGEPRSW